MPEYRRTQGGTGTWFFTVVSRARRPVLTDPRVRVALREAVTEIRARFPFRVDAWVLLPDHIHCIWTLPESDHGYSFRWSMIKRLTSQKAVVGRGSSDSMRTRRERKLWQRRFWDHAIRDENDFDRHLEYCYWNPVKHGLVSRVRDWPWSTFHRDVQRGMFSPDWGGEVEYSDGTGMGEP